MKTKFGYSSFSSTLQINDKLIIKFNDNHKKWRINNNLNNLSLMIYVNNLSMATIVEKWETLEL